MTLRLPPLNTLRLFEAASRCGSFRRAAEELGLTPSGVSHGIRMLEGWLGVQLFARTSRGLQLTSAGITFLPFVREALGHLANGTASVPGRAPRGTLTISAAPTFALRWLLRRLATFRALYPDITISIDTSHRLVEFPVDGIDLAVRMGPGGWDGVAAVELVRERLVPVCSPQIAKQYEGVINLADLPLIHVTRATEDWLAWTILAEVAPPSQAYSFRFDTIQMAMNAASQGLGVAVGRRPLIDDDLESGKLVELFGPAVRSTTGYWVVAPLETLQSYEAAAFLDWITCEWRVDAGSLQCQRMC